MLIFNVSFLFYDYALKKDVFLLFHCFNENPKLSGFKQQLFYCISWFLCIRNSDRVYQGCLVSAPHASNGVTGRLGGLEGDLTAVGWNYLEIPLLVSLGSCWLLPGTSAWLLARNPIHLTYFTELELQDNIK